MRNSFIKLTRFFGKLLGKKNATSLIKFLHRATDAPIMYIALNHYGILKGTDMKNSGEEFAMEFLYKPHLEDKDVLLDIGANTGDYAKVLSKFFRSNRIVSVEPNKDTYNDLVNNVDHECFNYAIALTEGQKSFYVSHENPTSTLGSLSPNSIPNNENLKEILVECTRLDSLVKRYDLNQIGLLKVDTEGFDFEVLKSGEALLANIKFIQFEFNEFHVFTRTFIRDFHLLLSPTHDLFRLDTNFLHDIRNYDPKMEIFRFQNILAVRKNLTHEISKYVKT